MNSKIKQQQTLITSKTLAPFKKKLNNEVSIPSDELETKQIILNHQKDMGPVYKNVW